MRATAATSTRCDVPPKLDVLPESWRDYFASESTLWPHDAA